MIPLDLKRQLRDAIDAGDPDEIQRLGELMDEADAERPTPTLLASALWYAEQGLHVFPLQPRAKVPHKWSHGCKDATTDPAAIREWWAAQPESNIGIATGHLVDVIDVDGSAGVLSWSRTMYVDEKYVGPEIVGRVSTPRPGGSHHYIAADPAKGNRAGILPGVDHRGAGGYVVAPPSVNAEGTPYIWTSPLEMGL